MVIGRIVGTVVSTQKDSKLTSMKLFVVEQTDLKGKGENKFVVAVDSVGAGVGELVLYASGSSARQTEVTANKPVDAVIMAIIDTIEIQGDIQYSKNQDAF